MAGLNQQPRFNMDWLNQYQQSNTPSNFLDIGNTPMVDSTVNQTGTQITPYTQSSAPLSNGTGGGEGGLFGNMLGQDGWGNLALGGLKTGVGAYMGMKQLGMAKDQLDFQKKAFNKNFETQKQRTNTQLADRQKRRHYEKPGYYQSPSDYMNKNGVK